jgi:hypothetical protein
MPEKQWYAVRCCCTPKKIFGFIRLPVGAKKLSLPLVSKPAEFVPWEEFPHLVEMERVEIEIKPISSMSGNLEYSIYSDDRPIEFWRRVPGFIEAK